MAALCHTRKGVQKWMSFLLARSRKGEEIKVAFIFTEKIYNMSG